MCVRTGTRELPRRYDSARGREADREVRQLASCSSSSVEKKKEKFTDKLGFNALEHDFVLTCLPRTRERRKAKKKSELNKICRSKAFFHSIFFLSLLSPRLFLVVYYVKSAKPDFTRGQDSLTSFLRSCAGTLGETNPPFGRLPPPSSSSKGVRVVAKIKTIHLYKKAKDSRHKLEASVEDIPRLS